MYLLVSSYRITEVGRGRCAAAVSRDCFSESLSVNRRKVLVEAYKKKYDIEEIYECPICIVESEIHMVQALEDIKKQDATLRFSSFIMWVWNFPHHGAVAFGHFGKQLFEVFKYIGVPVEEIGYNQPAGVRYSTENPWG